MVDESEFMPPQTRTLMVTRTAVLRRLGRLQPRKAAVVCAPAGYGKTTLLAQYFNTLCDRGQRCAFVTLNTGDRQDRRLVRKLVSALQFAGAPLDVLADKTKHSPPNARYREIIDQLVSRIPEAGPHYYLFIDDFSEGDTPANREMLGYLLDSMPSVMHLVIASRAYPELNLASLRLEDQLVSIDVDDLRFDESETGQLLQGEVQDEGDILTLLDKTEGWPIALQLARVWQAEGQVTLKRVRELSGENIEIADYLFEQVFQRLSEEEQVFACRTAVLERFNGDIANAICGRSDCWKTLEKFDKHGLFVVSLDDRRRWYRYHSLFRQFLLQRLAWGGESKVAECHTLAGKWLARQGDSQEAVRHFVMAGAYNLAADLVDRLGGWRLVWANRSTMLEEVCAVLPEELLQRHVRVQLGSIYMQARRGDAASAEAELRVVKRKRAGMLKRDPALATEFRTMEVLVAAYVDRSLTPAEIRDLETLVSDPSVLDVELLAIVHNYLCLNYLDECEFERANHEAGQSIAYYRAADFGYAVDVVRVHVAQSMVAQGRLSDAEVMCDMWVRNDQLLDETHALFRIINAEIAYERNQPDRAERLLDGVVEFIEDFGSWFNIYASMYRTLVMLARNHDSARAAFDVLDRTRAQAARRHIPRLEEFANLMAVREHVHRGDLPSARRLAAESKCLAEVAVERLRWQLGESRQALRVRLVLGEGRTDEVASMVQELPNSMTGRNGAREIIVNRLLTAVAHSRFGRLDDALDMLHRALELAATNRYERVFLDEGDEVLELVERLANTDQIAASQHTGVSRLIRRILSASARTAATPRGEQKLTQRECDVLKHIGLGLVSREIAARLNLSENTVRHHRKNLYRKLGVHSRSNAVAATRSLGMVS
mgnify:FL=1